MRLRQYCKKNHICYMTGYKWFKQGKIEGAYQLQTGTIMIKDEEQNQKEQNVVIYCRVSNRDRKKELEYQVDRCKNYCLNKGYNVNAIYKQIASGMNDNRKQFWKMIQSNPTKIIIQNKDRLTRFGFEYIKRLGQKLQIQIQVIFPNDNDQQDLIKDLVSIITSFCCRLYGLRRGYNKAKKIQEEIKNDNN